MAQMKLENPLNKFKKPKTYKHTDNVPKHLKSIFTTPKYNDEFLEYMEKNNNVLSMDQVTAFKNYYLKKHFVIPADSIDLRINHGELLKGFDYIEEKSVNKENFNEMFSSDIWGKLNFSQHYTFLHWLRDKQTEIDGVPHLDVISDSPNHAFYFMPDSHTILLPSSSSSALELAGGIIQATDHFNDIQNPKSNGEVKIRDRYVELTDYLKGKNGGLNRLMKLNLYEVPEHDREELLRVKNIAYPVMTHLLFGLQDMPMAKNNIETFFEFRNYLSHELYFSSPSVIKATRKRSDEINKIVDDNFPNADKELAKRYQRTAEMLKVGEATPVLNILKKSHRQKLLDLALKRRHFYATKQRKTKIYRNNQKEEEEFLLNFYNHIRDENGTLSRI